jgi:hypothetical protein
MRTMLQIEPSRLQKVAVVCRSWVKEWDEALLSYASIPLCMFLLLRFLSVFAPFSLWLLLPWGGFQPPSSQSKNRSSNHSALDHSTISTAKYYYYLCYYFNLGKLHCFVTGPQKFTKHLVLIQVWQQSFKPFSALCHTLDYSCSRFHWSWMQSVKRRVRPKSEKMGEHKAQMQYAKLE